MIFCLNNKKKTEEESFFELEDTDSLFSSWGNFLKAAGEDVEGGGDNEDQEHEQASTSRSASRQQPVKEACSLM